MPHEIEFALGERLTHDGVRVPAFGFEHAGVFVHDPRLSECGRYPVEPSHYGLTEESARILERLNEVFG